MLHPERRELRESWEEEGWNYKETEKELGGRSYEGAIRELGGKEEGAMRKLGGGNCEGGGSSEEGEERYQGAGSKEDGVMRRLGGGSYMGAWRRELRGWREL